jgi:uncharacterized protein
MSIDWNAFTPFSALAGGLLIGIAAAMFLLINGRIAGISSIVGGMLRPMGDFAWRVAFLAGLMLAPLVWMLVAALPEISIEASHPLLIVAGVIVGLGTRFAAGCTSGHGVCGISRLSPRSMLATLSFMATGFLTVFVVRHVWGGA